MSRKMNRRDFLKLLAAGTGGLVIASCTPETVTVIETKEVIKEVTPTAAPNVQAAVGDVLGTFPRRETLIVRQLTGRVGSRLSPPRAPRPGAATNDSATVARRGR